MNWLDAMKVFDFIIAILPSPKEILNVFLEFGNVGGRQHATLLKPSLALPHNAVVYLDNVFQGKLQFAGNWWRPETNETLLRWLEKRRSRHCVLAVRPRLFNLLQTLQVYNNFFLGANGARISRHVIENGMN